MEKVLHFSFIDSEEEVCQAEHRTKAANDGADMEANGSSSSEIKSLHMEVGISQHAGPYCNGLATQNGNNCTQLEAQKLTERQCDVLNLFRNVRSVQVVADRLGFRNDTARRHLREIRRRLGLESIRELLMVDGEIGELAKAIPVDVVTAARLLELIEQQGYRCALSGVELTPDTATLDHKTSRSNSGEHVMDNVWFLHRDVNRAKGTMSVAEFRRMCSRVVQWSEAEKDV